MRKLSVLLLAAFASLAFAQSDDCNRGSLAEGYCDRDGDLVADIPTDPAEWIDPDTLIFSYTPVEDPALYQDAFAEFLDHLSAVTGKDVEFFVVESYAAQQLALEAGRLHVAGVNTGNVPYAVNVSGFRPFAIMAALDGSHENSILGIANGDYEAAAVANSVLKRMVAREVVSEDDYVSIFTSQTFPTTGYGVVHNLHPDLQAKIEEAFFSFDWNGTALQEEFAAGGEEQFLRINYADAWAVVRTIDAELGIEYTSGQ